MESDHTDRKFEAVSVAASKQLRAKPMATELWHRENVFDHLDPNEMTSEIIKDSEWCLLQEGIHAAIRPLDALINRVGLKEVPRLGDAAMLCGTLGACGSSWLATQMYVPVSERALTCANEAEALDVFA